MLQFAVKDNIDQVVRQLDARFARQVPFATAKALTATAKLAQVNLRLEMGKVFDRPTPFTLNSTYVRPATKANLAALVKLKDEAFKGTPAARYLAPQITGGDRVLKRFERALVAIGALQPGWFAVPGQGARLNSYGNMSVGQVTQILSYLRANPDAMQNRTPRSGKRSVKRAGYFVGRPGNAPIGVWQRTQSGGVRPVLIFVKGATYAKRFDFEAVVRQTAERELLPQFRRALASAIASAR